MRNSYQRLLPPAGGPGSDTTLGNDGLPAGEFNLYHTADYTDEVATGSLIDYWRMLRQKKLVLLAAAVAGAGAGLQIARAQQPVYRARATVEVQEVNRDIPNMTAARPVDDSTGQD